MVLTRWGGEEREGGVVGQSTLVMCVQTTSRIAVLTSYMSYDVQDLLLQMDFVFTPSNLLYRSYK